MASPIYAATVNVNGAPVNGTDTSLSAPTAVNTVFTAGASGSMIYEIRTVATQSTAAGLVNIFRKRGTSYFIFDQIAVTAVSATATGVSYKDVRTYNNAVLPSGDTLLAAQTIGSNSGYIVVTCLGGDF